MPPQFSKTTQSYIVDGKTYTVPTGTSMEELDAYIKGGQSPKTQAPAASQRATRRNAMAQPGITPAQRAASPINQGVLRGLEDVATGASLATGIEAPLTSALSIGGGYLLGKGARLGAREFGASEGWQDAAEIGGNLVGSFGTARLTPGLRNMRWNPPEAPQPTEAEKLQASIDRAMARRAGLQAAKVQTEGVPAESLTRSPNLPSLLAARALAREEAREALETKMQTGSGPRISKSGVLRIPEPREALPTDTPGYLSSIPRERVPGLATQGYPGAGELLRNLGKPVIYLGGPEGYPASFDPADALLQPYRRQLPKPLILPIAAD